MEVGAFEGKNWRAAEEKAALVNFVPTVSSILAPALTPYTAIKSHECSK